MKTLMESSYMTTTQAARRLGISAQTVRVMCECGELRYWRRPGSSRYNVLAADVAKLERRAYEAQ